jgi:CDP-glucose 4,6-dehydratase
VTGYSLDVPTTPSLYEAARLDDEIPFRRGDVRELDAVTRELDEARPDVVFHLAAQPLVRRSYEEPVATFETNVLGTANVLEAARRCPTAKVVVVATSDKCYLHRGAERAYREDDPLGGDDPYSSSKACAELVTAAYRTSYFTGGAAVVASARAGNVIGGGDWALDRLVPDVIRAALAGTPVVVRNPAHVRPWQHVLSPLSGYLRLAERLADDPSLPGAWNFGPPDPEDARPVRWIVDEVVRRWGSPVEVRVEPSAAPETAVLMVDSTLARERLGWETPWALEQGLDATVEWYRAFAAGDDVRALSSAQIAAYAAAIP